MPNITGLVTTAALNTKRSEVENKIIDIVNLDSISALDTKATRMNEKK